jgi:adenine phosphoribosyltransferase
MLEYGIVAQPGHLLAIDTDHAPPRVVYRWVLVEVTKVDCETIFFADASGNLRSLHMAERLQCIPAAGDKVFVDRDMVIDIAQNGLPAHPLRIRTDFFPQIEVMYQPVDSPYLRLVDTNTQGQRNDVTPLFSDYAAFSALVHDLAVHFEDVDPDCVAGIDALGFILGTALAWHFEVGFVPIRKGEKLPVPTHSAQFVDYSGQRKSLELRKDALKAGAKVLIVDDWIETGAQVKAAVELVEHQGCTVVGIAAINIDDNPETQVLKAQYNSHTVWGVVENR